MNNNMNDSFDEKIEDLRFELNEDNDGDHAECDTCNATYLLSNLYIVPAIDGTEHEFMCCLSCLENEVDGYESPDYDGYEDLENEAYD